MYVRQHPILNVAGVVVFQDESDDASNDKRIHFVADLSVDVDGARLSYRLDNNPRLALDDIHRSAGYPHSSWWNVLVRDPDDPERPYVDADGYCVSMTSYTRDGYDSLDRRKYLDAATIPYLVLPGAVRSRCRGTILGCKARLTDIRTFRYIDCICGDFSGYSIGEASLAAAQFFDKTLSARNGDEHKHYLYEFWPDRGITIDGESFPLRPMHPRAKTVA